MSLTADMLGTNCTPLRREQNKLDKKGKRKRKERKKPKSKKNNKEKKPSCRKFIHPFA